jgi:hypothetical protein
MSTWIPGMKKINACCIKFVIPVGYHISMSLWSVGTRVHLLSLKSPVLYKGF